MLIFYKKVIKILDKEKVYYVYEWIRLDTNEPFYVGKGKGNRWCCLSKRNKYFNRIVNSKEVAVYILHKNLDEETAFDYEWYYIDLYRNIGFKLTNVAEGGEGGIHLYGENNPMYGRTWWDDNTPRIKIENWKKKVASKGELNPMYGISPRERMSKKTYLNWLKKKSISVIGERNPNFNNHTLKNKYKDNPELAKINNSRPRERNGRSRPIIMYDMNMNLIKSFPFMGACGEWLIENGYSTCKIKTLRDKIRLAIKNKNSYLGFIFKYNN